MRRDTIRGAIGKGRPLATPLARGALSARLSDTAGFQAFANGGSTTYSALTGLRTFADGTRDMVPGPNHKAVRAALGESLNLARWRMLETEYALADTTASERNTV